jgi:hypothetical protein
MTEDGQNGNDEPQAAAVALSHVRYFAAHPKVKKNDDFSTIGLISRF